MSWKLQSENILFKNKFINLIEKETVHPTLGSHNFYTIDFPNWVNIVAITNDNRLILVRQYRHGLEQITLEIPGGVVDNNENPMETAKRELLEETGYEGHLIPLGKVASNPAIQNNYCYIYLCVDCKKVSSQKLDDTEDICVELIPVEWAENYISKEKVTHSLSVVSLLKARLYLEKV